jgi:predicted DNA-binding transcriptional regulator YafY
MNLIRNFNRVERLHQLIQAKKTGNPKQLASRLGISRATLYVLIDELNSLNLVVAYSRKYETFYYEKDVKLTIQFKVESLETSEVRKIYGGSIDHVSMEKYTHNAKLNLHAYLSVMGNG